ncbi:MAG: major capsid protein P2 [Parvibaculum sp.]|uniref:major capsid protein P2 n=1 Tax=Parvibaculum sp. TaxID=2024848 RepID=UPI0027218CD1|nr:major capsid protein P2 [Parvibaculum sp.]MDO8840425.1 major capsid protein P2 [Parvibaculum sp.]
MSQFMRTVPLATINGVASPGRATIDMPADRRYHCIMLEYRENGVLVTQANMELALTNISIRLDGTAQREFSAAQLNVMNALRGMAYQNGRLFIWFREPWHSRLEDQDRMAWSLQRNAQTFQIEVDIAAGRTNPTLTASAVVDNVVAPLIMRKTRRLNVPVTSTGVRTEANMHRSIGDYSMLHCFEATANDISAVKVYVDQVLAFDRTRLLNNAVLTARGFTPAAAVFHINFEEFGTPLLPLPMRRGDGGAVGELRFDFDMAAAASFNILAEYIGARD